MRFPSRPSRRAVANHLRFLNGETEMLPAPAKRKGGKQPESKVGEANRQWAKLKGGVLWRNRRGMLPLANGTMLPFGLGPPGFPDEVGYLPIRITQSMVNRVIPVLCCIEDKTDSGAVAEHQLRVLEELKDAGAIAGVCRNVDEAEALLQAWLAKATADER